MAHPVDNAVQSQDLSALSRLRVLVLNADGCTMGTVPRHVNWAEAVTLVLAGRVSIMKTSEFIARSPNRFIEVPSVIMVRTYQHDGMLAALAHFNRWHLFLRDEGICQYTGARLHLKSNDPTRQATVDHVLPVSRGGQNAWNNCVLASSEINGRKGAKLPAEAGLVLQTEPRSPRVIDIQASWFRLNQHQVPENWRKFMTDTYEHWGIAA